MFFIIIYFQWGLKLPLVSLLTHKYEVFQFYTYANIKKYSIQLLVFMLKKKMERMKGCNNLFSSCFSPIFCQ